MTEQKKIPNYITHEGIQKLKAEYHHLLYTERPELVKVIAWAASNGDRSENADYIYGKRRLRQIDSRLHFLIKRIENAEIINPSQIQNDKIVFGATVQLETEEGDIKTYKIVGEDEIDTSGGKISWKSPVAKALLGKTTGDEVEIQTPKGMVWYSILDIKYI